MKTKFKFFEGEEGTNVDWEMYLSMCSERSLWCTIYSLGGALFNTRHDLADGRYESTPSIERWLEEAQKQIEQAVDEIARFGVDNPRTVDGNSTADYWDWYHRWKTKWNDSDESSRQSWQLATIMTAKAAAKTSHDED